MKEAIKFLGSKHLVSCGNMKLRASLLLKPFFLVDLFSKHLFVVILALQIILLILKGNMEGLVDVILFK